jgi:hypothetical protein
LDGHNSVIYLKSFGQGLFCKQNQLSFAAVMKNIVHVHHHHFYSPPAGEQTLF